MRVTELAQSPAQSIDAILAWDFDRIIVGHGTTIETGGKAALRDAFAFLSGR